MDPFYISPGWRKARQAAILRDGYCCTNCGVSVRGKGAARVDHRLPRLKFPDLALHLPNLRTLCVKCDQARHHRDKLGQAQGDAIEIGVDGFPVNSGWAK